MTNLEIISTASSINCTQYGISFLCFLLHLMMYSLQLQQERRDAELRAKREEEEQRKRREEKRRQQEEQKRREEEELFRRKQVRCDFYHENQKCPHVPQKTVCLETPWTKFKKCSFELCIYIINLEITVDNHYIVYSLIIIGTQITGENINTELPHGPCVHLFISFVK